MNIPHQNDVPKNNCTVKLTGAKTSVPSRVWVKCANDERMEMNEDANNIPVYRSFNSVSKNMPVHGLH